EVQAQDSLALVVGLGDPRLQPLDVERGLGECADDLEGGLLRARRQRQREHDGEEGGDGGAWLHGLLLRSLTLASGLPSRRAMTRRAGRVWSPKVGCQHECLPAPPATMTRMSPGVFTTGPLGSSALGT